MLRRMVLLMAVLCVIGARPEMTSAKTKLVKMKIVKAKNPTNYDKYRKILVSPTINTPKPFKGFGGFCGWPKICRLKNGDLYVTFSAGYWHASWPTPFERNEPPEYAKHLYRRFPWLAKWDAPEGGRMMWIRSKDNGKTWTRPKFFPSVPGAYGITDVIQLRDGTMVAVALIELGHGYRGMMPTTAVEFARTWANRFPMKQIFFRSDDDGRTWREVCRLPGPYPFMTTSHDFYQARDGALMLLTSAVPIPAGKGWPEGGGRFISMLMRSVDKGSSWTIHSIVGSNDFTVEEGAAAVLPDGSIGFGSRPTSAWFQSYDDGKTWSKPRQLHAGRGKIFKKGDLVVTPDGVVVIVTCGGPGGNGQVMYSRDSGKTWIKPAPDRGFKFDPLAYYPDACVLEDGSIFAVGDNQGFKNKYGPYGSRVTAMRFRIKTPEEGEGIELLPIGGPRIKKVK